MLAGIVISGVYAKSTRATLPVNEPVSVAGAKLTFLRVVPGTAERKQAMEVRVRAARGGRTSIRRCTSTRGRSN
jgi:hypothetical protein